MQEWLNIMEPNNSQQRDNRIQLVEPIEDLTHRALLPINTATKMQVSCQEELEMAGELVRVLRDLQEEINKVFEPIVSQAFKAHKAAKKAQNDHLQPLVNAETSLRLKMSVWLREQEALHQQAVEKQQKEIQQIQQQQEKKKSFPQNFPQAKLSASSPAPKLTEIPPKPRVEGIHTATEWKWKVLDVSLIPPEFWVLDEKAIDAVVKVQKGQTLIPGIEVFSQANVVVTTKP